MFADFKSAFKDKPSYESKIPKAVLEAMSKGLPKNFKYIDLEDGVCAIESERDFTISFFGFDLSAKDKSNLPDNPTLYDVQYYAYNSQKKIRLLPNKEKCFLVNGEEVLITDFIKAPFKSNESVTGDFFLIPPSFSPPFPFIIGNNKCQSATVMVERKPIDSTNLEKFVSVDDSMIKLEYILNKTTQNITFSISLNTSKAKTIKEIIDGINICNAFCKGKGMLMGSNIHVTSENGIPEEVLRFWNKVFDLETCFDVHFNPSEILAEETIKNINKFYQCFIERKPFRENETIQDVTLASSDSYARITEIIGKELYLEMTTQEMVVLFGVEIQYHVLTGVFNACIEAIDSMQNDTYKIKIETSQDKNMYLSTILFKTENEINKFKENKDYINVLRMAQLLG